MNGKRASLEQIQRWMQSVIMHPGGVSEGIESPEARRHLDVAPQELESVVRASRALDSHARLEIYVDAYYERLLECLREEFTATRHAVGDELFDALAFGYLQQYPSRSYTLNLLGACFPRFLAESRLHERDAPEDATTSWADFIIELATFERLQRDVFDAPGSEGREVVGLEHLAQAAPQIWGNLRLTPAPCLRLHIFEHPVHEYWHALKIGEIAAVPAARKTYLAINRREYIVERHELSGAQFALLDALGRGQTLSEAILASPSLPLAATLEQGLGPWFERWTREGFFVELTHSH